jgi:ribosome-associated protein
MLQISKNISIASAEIELIAIRSQGTGGQNVNKISSAIHLRFDIKKSSLDAVYKNRLLQLKDKRISKKGILIIKAQQYRTQEKNRTSALQRLKKIIESIVKVQKYRIATKPTKNSRTKRLNLKTKRGQLKKLRSKLEN